MIQYNHVNHREVAKGGTGNGERRTENGERRIGGAGIGTGEWETGVWEVV